MTQVRLESPNLLTSSPFPRYGGESAMMEAVGHDTKVNFRVNVMFCLCLWCPNGVLLTKTRIRYIKAAVFQMPYIQVSSLGDIEITAWKVEIMLSVVSRASPAN